VVLQYNYTGRSERLTQKSPWKAAVAGSVYKEQEEIYISVPGADRFGAGVVRGRRRLHAPDFTIGTQQEIVESLRIMDPTSTCSRILKCILKEDPDFTFPAADLVTMTSFMICQANSPLVQIPAPSDNVRGITVGPLGRGIFTQPLDVYIREKNSCTIEDEKVDWEKIEVGRQTCWVLRRLKELQESFPRDFDAQEEYEDAWIVRKPVRYLQRLNDIFDEASMILQNQQNSGIFYKQLLQGHLMYGVFAHGDESISKDNSESAFNYQRPSEDNRLLLLSTSPNCQIFKGREPFFQTRREIHRRYVNDDDGKGNLLGCFLFLRARRKGSYCLLWESSSHLY
jgi:hypothetical protein